MEALKCFSFAGVAMSVLGMMMFSSCQESLEQRAERESREYTEKFCPTPPENGVISDSLVFDSKTKTQYYYLTFTGEIDNAEAIANRYELLKEGLIDQVRSDSRKQAYKDAGFNFAYICRSQKTGKIIINLTVTKKDYQ